MSPVAIVQIQFTVTADDIDELGHVNNQVYFRWMEQAARYASECNGWSGAQYIEHGFAWVARQHWLEYLRPCFSGDQIEVYTWVQAQDCSRCLRRYAVKNKGKIAAVGATEWDFISLKTQRMIDCPPEVADHFLVVPDDDERLKQLGVARRIRYTPLGLV